MWFYYIQTGLAILAAAKKIMVIQFVSVGIIDIMHYLPFLICIVFIIDAFHLKFTTLIRARYENDDVDVFFIWNNFSIFHCINGICQLVKKIIFMG